MDESEKQMMFEEQQAILAARKDPTKKKKYYEEVEKRRKDLDAALKAKKIIDDGNDPIIQWREKRKAGIIKDLKYDEAPERSLPIPASPLQIPRFDNGERFDLRLPYVDRGYEDPESDVVGKVASFFGLGKKQTQSKPNATASAGKKSQFSKK